MPSIWASRRTPSPDEQAIVAAILRSSGDPRAELFLKQFLQGPLDRSPGRNMRTVSLRQTTADLLTELDSDVASTPIRVSNLYDGGTLEFRVFLCRGGFFGSLVGTSERAWPRRWAIDPAELPDASDPSLAFPREECDLHPLADWFGVPIAVLATHEFRAPARSEALDGLEKREEAPLPPGCRDLLELSDGFTSGETSVLGSADLYVIPFGDGDVWWLVGIDSHGAQFVCGERGVFSLPEPRADLGSLNRVAPSYRAWVQALIT